MYRHVFLHHGPSRFVWFLVGAGVATFWHHSSLMRDHRAQYFPCVMHRRPVQDGENPPAPRPTWGPDRTVTGWPQQSTWDQDVERLKHLQKRAGETVADLSESTLDSIVTTAESLKARLAQLRVERERSSTVEGEKKVAPPVA